MAEYHLVTVPNYNLDQVEDPSSKPTASNSLSIPKLDLEVSIGATPNPEESLSQGVWLDPNSDLLDEAGNTVLVGHRFQFQPQVHAPFYHLDKLVSGDDVFITWNGQTHQYRVSESLVVEPEAIDAVYDQRNNTVTLYTCTPLFTNQQRLVVRAVRV